MAGSKQDPHVDAAPLGTATAPPAPSEAQSGFVVASHDVLFAPSTKRRCDACDRPLIEADETERFDPQGEGVYLWARGDEVRYERAPLCAACASAIGMTALARWEIEEEEG